MLIKLFFVIGHWKNWTTQYSKADCYMLCLQNLKIQLLRNLSKHIFHYSVVFLGTRLLGIQATISYLLMWTADICFFHHPSRSDHATTKKSLKQQREEQKKASEASGDTRAWNSLFMRPDTVWFYFRYKSL